MKAKTLTLGQAAKLTGKSKSTLSAAIKNGKLTARRLGAGYEIEPSELFRVYEKVMELPTAPNPKPDTSMSVEERLKMAALEKDLHYTKEMLAKSEEDKQEMKTDRDKWRQQATLFITQSEECKKRAEEIEKVAQATKEALLRDLQAATEALNQHRTIMQRIQRKRLGRWLIKRVRD